MSRRDLFERLVRQVLSADYHDDALATEGACYAESGTQLAWEVFQAVLKLPTETVDNPVENDAAAAANWRAYLAGAITARDVFSVSAVDARACDEWEAHTRFIADYVLAKLNKKDCPGEWGDYAYESIIAAGYVRHCEQARASLSASTEAAAGEPVTVNRSVPFPNCKFRECDLPGQCRGEGRCHHPVSGDRDAPAASGQKLTDEQREALKHLIARGSTFPDHNGPNGSVSRVDYRHLHAAASVLSDLLHASNDSGQKLTALQAEVERLNAIINTPQSDDFLRAVSIEAEHQRQRWGSEHDSGKAPADWFWLVGYLAGKALHAHADGDVEKAEHHIITTSAACANWHRAMFGKTEMRPGIDGEAALRASSATASGKEDQ